MTDVKPEPMQLDIAVVVKKYQDRVMQLLSTNIMLEAQLEAVMEELAQSKAKERSNAPSNGTATPEPTLVAPSSS